MKGQHEVAWVYSSQRRHGIKIAELNQSKELAGQDAGIERFISGVKLVDNLDGHNSTCSHSNDTYRHEGSTVLTAPFSNAQSKAIFPRFYNLRVDSLMLSTLALCDLVTG